MKEHSTKQETAFALRWEFLSRLFLSAGWTDPAAFVAAVTLYGIDCKCMATKTMMVSMCFIVMCRDDGTPPTITGLRQRCEPKRWRETFRPTHRIVT